MSQERWKEVERLFEEARARAPGERAAFLAAACDGDAALRREIESLLAYEAEAETFIGVPAAEIAARAFAADADTLPQGSRLGPYVILAPLGKGGMGEVYLARDERLGRKVAVKLLPPAYLTDPDRVRRFVLEARAASALNHPNILTIHEIGEADGHRLIVTEYVEGETLRQLMDRGPLQVGAAVEVAAQVAGALQAAHAAGIVHRDIKPENVMVRPDGLVKVLDFGLAKLTAAGPTGTDAPAQAAPLSTASGMVLGTVAYMSPEQARGQPLDGRTDVFSLGVMLYEMVAGERPFKGDTAGDLIAALLTAEPPPLSQRQPQVPAALERVITTALRKDREARYQTVADLRRDLEGLKLASNWQEDRDTRPINHRAQPTGQLTGALPVTHRGRRRAAIAAVALAIIVAVTAYALYLRPPALTPGSNPININSAAYDSYLRGKLDANSQNRDSNESAIKLLEQAVNADPGFAPAYAELARAYNIKANFFAPDAEKKKLKEDAKVAVEKSLALNPNLAEGHFVRGYLLWTPANRFPHEQAIQSFKRAIALDPNLGEAHHQLGVIYMHIGLLDKAWDEMQKALSIDPSDTLARFRLGSINVCRAKYEEALAVLKTVPREADPAIVNRATATALFHLGRTQEASEVVEDYLKTYAKDEGGNVTSVKAMILAKAGREREAEETIRRAVEIGRGFTHFHHTTYNIASAYALLAKPEQAVKWLENTADDGFPCYPLFENDANLNSLRQDERFIALMARLRQQWEHYQATL